MRRRKKLARFLVILLIAVLVGLFILHRIGLSRLASRGGGTIPTADQLVYPDLTDEENAAILYRAAWNTLKDSPEGTSDDAQTLISEYTKITLARILVTKEEKQPEVTPALAVREISPRALQQQRENNEEPLSKSDMEIAAVILSEAAPALEILRQVHETKGALFFNDHSPQALVNNNEKDNYKMMRGLARYIAARALRESEQGNTEAAVDWVAIGLHRANDLSDESVIIGELVKVAIAEIMLSAAQGILHERPVSEPIPKALLDKLGDLRDRTHYGDSLRREVVFSEALAEAQ